MELKKIMSLVLTVLGIKAFSRDDSGKPCLTDEQQAALTEKYGEKFVTGFVSDLAKYQEEASGVAPLTAQERLELDATRQQVGQLRQQIQELQQSERDLRDTIAQLEKQPASEEGRQVTLTDFEQAARKAGVDLSLKHNRFLSDYMQGKVSAAYSGDDTIDTQELKKEFGLYVDSSRLEIMRSLIGTTESTQYMSTVMTDKTEIRATHAAIDKIVQQFFPEFSPQGKTLFRPLVIKNFKLKANVQIIPSDVMTDILGYLYDEQAQTLQSMPVVRYIINQLIKPKMEEEREYMLATGRFKEAVKNASGQYETDASEALDGYLTQLVDHYNADDAEADEQKKTGISWLQKGVAITPDGDSGNVRTVVDAAVKQVADEHPLYAKKKMKVHIDPVLADAYRREYLEEYKWLKNQDGTHKNDIDFSNFEFAELEGLRGTGCFFITPKENFKHLLSKDPNAATIRFLENHYSVDIMIEWWEGTGFWLAEALFAYIAPEAAVKYGQVTVSAGGADPVVDDDF